MNERRRLRVRRIAVPVQRNEAQWTAIMRSILADGEWHLRSELDAVAGPAVPVHTAVRRYYARHQHRKRLPGGDALATVIGIGYVLQASLNHIAEKSPDGRGQTRRWRLKKKEGDGGSPVDATSLIALPEKETS